MAKSAPKHVLATPSPLPSMSLAIGSPENHESIAADRIVLSKFSIYFSIMIFGYGVFYYFAFHAPRIALGCVVSAIACASAPIVHRATRSSKAADLVLIFACLGCVLYSSLLTGGIRSPILLWLTCVPAVAGYLTRDAKWTVTWTIISGGCLGPVHVFHQLYQVESEVADSAMTTVHLLALSGIWSTHAYMSILFLKSIVREFGRANAKTVDLERAMQSLKDAQQTALEAERLAAIGMLAAGVAHEIGNSITSLRLGARVLDRVVRTGIVPTDLGEMAAVYNLSVDRIQEVISGLSSATRPDSSPELVSIGRLVDQARSLTGSKTRSVTIAVTGDLDSHVLLPRSPVVQALINLVGNAADVLASRADGRIEIHCKRDRSKLTISVSDNGPGVKDDDRASIFNAFFTRKRDQGGTGLGLYVSRRDLRACGGDLQLDHSLQQSGARFTITVPIGEPT